MEVKTHDVGTLLAVDKTIEREKSLLHVNFRQELESFPSWSKSIM